MRPDFKENETILGMMMFSFAIIGVACAVCVWLIAPKQPSPDDYNVDAELNRALIEVIIKSHECQS